MRLAFLVRVAFAAALVVAAGCSNNKSKIEGTWESTAATVKGEDLPEGTRRLQFAKDGHLFYTVLGKQYKGSYSLGMGPAVTFTLEQDLDGRKIHPHKIVINGEQLTLTSADGSALAFRKIN
ncbi:MAG TPA: hypothetical protein VMF69_24170 [Gemmataceae bacterium]|nr:hypothetical protein [Gemmataceae bacterium]